MFTGFTLAAAVPGFESGQGPSLHGSFLSLRMNNLCSVILKLNALCTLFLNFSISLFWAFEGQYWEIFCLLSLTHVLYKHISVKTTSLCCQNHLQAQILCGVKLSAHSVDFPDLLWLEAKSFSFISAWQLRSFYRPGSDMVSLSPLIHFTTILCGRMHNWSKAPASESNCLILISRGLLAITNHWPEVGSERWLHRLIMGCPTALTGYWRRHGCSSSKPQPIILPPPFLLVCSHSTVFALCFFFSFLWERVSGRVRDWEKKTRGEVKE